MEDYLKPMQQLQEKQQPKTLSNHSQQNITPNYRPSPLPTVLATTAKVCYGLSAASVALSVAVWNGTSLPKPSNGKQGNGQKKGQPKPSEREVQESQRLGAFVGLWASTLAVAGKILDDASERAARYDFANWEKNQGGRGQGSTFRPWWFSR
jgi:hypothetical protein